MPPQKKRTTTPRQRRKHAARTRLDIELEESAGAATDAEEPVEKETAKKRPRGTPEPAKSATAKPAKPDTPSWTRRQIAILVAVTMAINTVISIMFYSVLGHVALGDAVVELNPFFLAPASMLAMPFVYKRIGARRMRLTESLLVGAMIGFVSLVVFTLFLTQLNPAQTATAGPTPSPAAKSVSPTPPATRPSPSARGAATATSAPCPIDNPTCHAVVNPQLAQEESSAVIVSDVVAVGVTIWGFPALYKMLWMPETRLREREQRRKKRD